jgi:hypothetical protein
MYQNTSVEIPEWQVVEIPESGFAAGWHQVTALRPVFQNLECQPQSPNLAPASSKTRFWYFYHLKMRNV